MPGNDRTQAQLISAVQLQEALAQFALVNTQARQDQIELLALMRAKFSKSPSVYKTGTWRDNSFVYPVVGSDDSTAFWITNGASSIFVIPVGDADKIRIIAYGGDDGGPVYVAYSLSPNDARNPIPLSQFAYLKFQGIQPQAFNYQGGESVLTFNADIPISGNIDPVSGNVNETFGISDTSGTISASNSDTLASNLVQLCSEIPCAGNKYIHIIGSTSNGSDLLTDLINNNWSLTYELIK